MINKKNPRHWSGNGSRHKAYQLEPGVFRETDPLRVAASLKRSADASVQRNGSPYESAMSILNFYLNRSGKNLGVKQRKVLENAKVELAKLYRTVPGGPPRG